MSKQEISKMKELDLQAIFANKNPKLANRLPKFIFSILNRLLHIDELNYIIRTYGHLSGYEFLESVFEYFNISFEFKGLDQIPEDGRFIFASNHPLGGFDGMLLLYAICQAKSDIQFLVNDVLLEVAPLKEFFVPINKHGSQRESSRLIGEAYNSKSQIAIFPSGLASRKRGKEIRDLEWKKHFITKAVKYKRDIIPVHISGQNSRHFYWIDNLLFRLRIKSNLVMFLLPDEMFRQKNQKITITFGDKIEYTSFNTKEKSYSEWGRWVEDIVYNLPKK